MVEICWRLKMINFFRQCIYYCSLSTHVHAYIEKAVRVFACRLSELIWKFVAREPRIFRNASLALFHLSEFVKYVGVTSFPTWYSLHANSYIRELRTIDPGRWDVEWAWSFRNKLLAISCRHCPRHVRVQPDQVRNAPLLQETGTYLHLHKIRTDLGLLVQTCMYPYRHCMNTSRAKGPNLPHQISTWCVFLFMQSPLRWGTKWLCNGQCSERAGATLYIHLCSVSLKRYPAGPLTGLEANFHILAWLFFNNSA